MIVVLEHGVRDKDKQEIVSFLEGKGFRVREIQGEVEIVLGAVGIVPVDVREVELLAGVARVIPITQPYKMASREFKKEDTTVAVGPVKIGGARIAVIAGPCAVESRDQILEIARRVQESGAVILRAGAYKPRTSPYAFQGLGEEGLRYLKEAGEATGMPVISEIVSPEHVELFRDMVDIFQVGARNMQNFELLKRVGALGKPVLLKRGLAATIEELLMSAEYLLAHGTDSVILCERGIRTFETSTRNTLDLSAIPVVKKLSHLPIFVDPSHGTGIREKVLPMALAAVAAGADGISVEVHTDPDHARSDGPQSLYPEQFEKLMRDIEALAPVLSKELTRLPERALFRTIAAGPEATQLSGSGQGVRGKVALNPKDIKVGYQGEAGAFSENALRRSFPEGVTAVPLTEFRDVFDAVLEGRNHYGIVPLENTLTGSIHQNYDLLLQYPDIRIVGEKIIRIIHNLIGTPEGELESIRRVFSHPQALSQCARFLEKYPQWEQIPFYDTAGSVAHIAALGSPENAAIASLEAVRAYGMKMLKEGIETNSRNYTRFVIIAREELAAVDAPTRASLVFSTANTPGSLYEALKILAERNINMVKLESRPIAGKPWQEMFYVDVDIPRNPEAFEPALEALKQATQELRLLGLYAV
jgi:3-deoxy-7-phosphoheptulonate synthase